MQNIIRHVTVRYTGPKFLTDIQYKSLGYVCGGSERTEETEWVDDSNSLIGAKPVTKTRKYATYGRHIEYPSNFLLGLVASLMAFVRGVRSIVKWLLPFAIIVVVLLGSMSDDLAGYAALVVLAYLITWGATLLLMFFAKLIRNSFQMDQRMDEICQNNGWMRWSEYRSI